MDQIANDILLIKQALGIGSPPSNEDEREEFRKRIWASANKKKAKRILKNLNK